MKIEGPCLNCEDRYVTADGETCHSVCERYKSYKQSLKEQNEKIREGKKELSNFVQWSESTKDKVKGRYGKKRGQI